MTTQDFKDEAYSEGTSQAYITLLTIDHPDLNVPLRYTDDHVPTISNSHFYSPRAFQAGRPDKVQGQVPQATLRIDNTNSDLVALLRGLEDAFTVKIAMVRASDLDTEEEAYSGLIAAGFDESAAFIDITLTLEDLDSAVFPPRKFDRSWEAVWPG